MNLARFILPFPILAVSAALAMAQPVTGSHARPMTPEQAISVSSQGQNVSVAGVASVSEANGLAGTFIRIKAPDSDVPFVGYISTDNQRQFPNPDDLAGRTIEMTGVIDIKGSVPMIDLTSADQVTILR